jgi:RecA-family ATPase
VLDGWFPARTVAMLFGAGGVGKTLLMQQFANSVATGEPFLGIDTIKMPVLSVMCEDDADEVKRRQLCINESVGVDEFASGPENLHLWPRVGSDNVLVTWPAGGQDEPGAFYKQLCDKVAAVKGDSDSVLVLLDTAADMFGGSENTRREVNTFIKTYLGSIVITYNATVVLLAHPSLSGLSSGSGLSGSTAWENSVRARSYLSREEDSDDVRILSRKKSNYSDISGNNDIKLIWENGVLAIPSSPDALDRINSTALKHAIMAEVDIAWGEKNAIRKQGPRGYKTTLPAMLKQHKPGAVIKAFNDLIMGGNIVHIERFGFKTEKGI